MIEQTNDLFSRVQQLAAEYRPKQEKVLPAMEKPQTRLEHGCLLPRSIHAKEPAKPEKLPDGPPTNNVLARKDAEWQATIEEYKRILRKCF